MYEISSQFRGTFIIIGSWLNKIYIHVTIQSLNLFNDVKYLYYLLQENLKLAVIFIKSVSVCIWISPSFQCLFTNRWIFRDASFPKGKFLLYNLELDLANKGFMIVIK